MPVPPRRQRDVSRWVHLVASALIGTFVYAPAAITGPMRPWMQVVVIPVLAASGVFMWQQARLRRLLRDRRGPKPTREMAGGTTS